MIDGYIVSYEHWDAAGLFTMAALVLAAIVAFNQIADWLGR